MSYSSNYTISLKRDEKLLEILCGLYGESQSYERRRVIHAFRRCLTWQGFEKYVEKLYALRRGYGISVKRRSDDSKKISDDHGVDVEGTKQDEEGNWKGVFIQCKRYGGMKTKEHSGIVGRNDIAKFLGDSQSPNNRRGHPVELVFATTSYFHEKAISEANAQGMTMIGCVDLARIDLEEYPLSQFIKDLLTKGKENDRELFLDWEYVLAYFDVKLYLSESTELADEAKKNLEELKVELKPFSRNDCGIENAILPSRFELKARNWHPHRFKKRYEFDGSVPQLQDTEMSGVSFSGLVLAGTAIIFVFWALLFLVNGGFENKSNTYVHPVDTAARPKDTEGGTVITHNTVEARKKNIPSKKILKETSATKAAE